MTETLEPSIDKKQHAFHKRRRSKRHAVTSNIDGIALSKKVLRISFFIALTLQVFVSEGDHLIALFAVLCGFLLMLSQLKLEYLKKSPIPSLVLFGFFLSYFYLPVIGKTLQWESIGEGLKYTDSIFPIKLAACVVIVAAHHFVMKVNFCDRMTTFLRTKLIQPIGILTPPSSIQLWMFGFIGVVATAAMVFGSNQHAEQEAGGIFRYIQWFKIFMYAPFLLLVGPLYGSRSNDSIIVKQKLLLYLGLVVIVGLGTNSRATLVYGIAATGLAMFYSYWIKIITISNRSFGKIGIYGIIGLVVLSQFQDISTAMKVVRAQRADVSGVDLIQLTLKAYNDEGALRRYRDSEDEVRRNGWEEGYQDNEIINRLSNPYYTDAAFTTIKESGSAEIQAIKEVELNRIAVNLPTPLLRLLGIKVDKEEISSFSMGDYYFYVRTGNKYVLGSFVTGNLMISLITVFGYYAPLFLFVSLALAFMMFNALMKRSRSSNPIRISAMALLSFYHYTFWISSAGAGCENLNTYIGFFIRGFWQSLLLYCMIFWVTRYACSLLVKHEKIIA